MRRLPPCLAAVLATLAASSVHAEAPPSVAQSAGASAWSPAPVPPPVDRPAVEPGAGVGVPIALAVNSPQAWPFSFAASAWVGLDRHQAVRANFARYRAPLWAAVLGPLLAEDTTDENGDPIVRDFGHTTDVSLGWAYFPHQVLDGLSLELAGMLRFNRLRDHLDDRNVAKEEHHTNVYGARALAAWTLRASQSWFFSVGVGAALGYERGREQTVHFETSEGMTHEVITKQRVSRLEPSVEAYLRVGLAFGQDPWPRARSSRAAKRN